MYLAGGRYQLSGALPSEDGREALADLAGLDIVRYPHDPLLPRVWELRTSVTAYDAVYLALAEGSAIAHAGPAAGPRPRSRSAGRGAVTLRRYQPMA
jgi:hypothetical protein